MNPTPRKQRRSLLANLLRVVLIAAGVVLALFLLGGWYFSNEIRDGALQPPTNEAPDYPWTVANAGSSLSLEGSSSTNQAGEAGLSGIAWDSGYAQSLALVSSTEDGGDVTDVRSMNPDTVGPPAGSTVKVDPYYWRGDPFESLGIEFETVHYASDIGSFPAWYIEGTSDTWAIVLHGKGGERAEGIRAIPTLQDLGYHILVISYRNDVGEARDPSGYFTYGDTDWVDLAGAVTYAHEHGATDHVLFGYSYAGTIISSYLTQSPLRNFTKAAILDSPVLSFEATVDYGASLTDLPILPIKLPTALTAFAKQIASWRFDIDWDATNYLEQTDNLHAPMLILHGTEDLTVPYQTSREMAQRRPDITTLVTSEAGHIRPWNVGPDVYDAAIKEFLTGLE